MDRAAQILRPRDARERYSLTLHRLSSRFTTHPFASSRPPASPIHPRHPHRPTPPNLNRRSHLPTGCRRQKRRPHRAPLRRIDSIEQAPQLAGKQIVIPFSRAVSPSTPAPPTSPTHRLHRLRLRPSPSASSTSVQFPPRPTAHARIEDAARCSPSHPRRRRILIPSKCILLEFDLPARAIRMSLPKA